MAKKVHSEYSCPVLADRVVEENGMMVRMRVVVVLRKRGTTMMMTMSSFLSWPRKSTVSTAVPSSLIGYLKKMG